MSKIRKFTFVDPIEYEANIQNNLLESPHFNLSFLNTWFYHPKIEIIEWAVNFGLLPNTMVCRNCSENCSYLVSRKCLDGYCWKRVGCKKRTTFEV